MLQLYVSMHTIIFPQTYISSQYFTKAIQVVLMGKQTQGTLLLRKFQKTTLSSIEKKMVHVIMLYLQLALSQKEVKKKSHCVFMLHFFSFSSSSCISRRSAPMMAYLVESNMCPSVNVRRDYNFNRN